MRREGQGGGGRARRRRSEETNERECLRAQVARYRCVRISGRQSSPSRPGEGKRKREREKNFVA